MDEDVIEDIANAFAEQLSQLTGFSIVAADQYATAIYDDIIAIATVINSHEPTYDMRYFYKRAGYPEPYPVHDMI